MSDLLFSFFFLGKGVVRTMSLFKKKKNEPFLASFKDQDENFLKTRRDCGSFILPRRKSSDTRR